MPTMLSLMSRERLIRANFGIVIRLLLLILCFQRHESSSGAQAVQSGSHSIVAAYSKQSCYERFPMARQLSESALPPEIRFFCAAPWNVAALASVKVALDQVGFDFIEASLHVVPLANRAELREQMRFNNKAALSGPPGLSEAYYAYKVLPLLNALMKGNPKVVAVVEKSFEAVDVSKMRKSLAIIDWSQPAFDLRVAAMMFTIASADTGQRAIELYVAPDPGIKLSELAESVLFSAMAPPGLVESATPFGEFYAPWLKSFLPFKLSSQLGMLSGNLAFSLARSRSIGDTSDLLKAAFYQDVRKEPLRIYVLNNFPANSCGIPTIREPAKYCAVERWILLNAVLREDVLDGIISVRENQSVGSAFPVLRSAMLYHELSHALFDPQSAASMPFLVEGRASAEGEVAQRATRAGLEVGMSRVAGFVDGLREALKSQERNPGEAKKKSEAEVSSEIERQSPTAMQRNFLRQLACRAPSVDFLVKQLSLSNASFRAQSLVDLQFAYAVSWAFHNFGFVSAEKSVVSKRQEVDISILYDYGRKLDRNEALDAGDKARIQGVLVKIMAVAAKRGGIAFRCEGH